MRQEGRSNDRKADRRPRGPAQDARPPEAHAAQGPTELFRKAVAACPFIDDDWPEYARALPKMEDSRAKVAWLLRWNRSRDQIADLTGLDVSTINYHAAHLRDMLGVPDCRDVGPKAGHLVNLARQREGRLILGFGAAGPGEGTGVPAARPPAKADARRRTPRGGQGSGAEGGEARTSPDT